MPELLLYTIKAFALIGVLMTLAAYTVLAERKISAWIQGRVGPNRALPTPLAWIPVLGPLLARLGVFQPMADGLKFFFKEQVLPAHVNRFYYCLAPIMVAVPALSIMALVPFGVLYDASGVPKPLILADVDLGILLVFALSSLGVYGLFLAGWASHSKYPYISSVRAAAQMISYELTLGMSILPVFLFANSPMNSAGLSLFGVVQAQESFWLVLWMPLPALIFLVSIFAETNRLPFDMAESETELVGGFHTEYGGFRFALFFLSEYVHMIVASGIFVLLFLGGWHFLPTFGLLSPAWANPWASWGLWGALASVLCFTAKTLSVIFLFIWVRWTLPRFRYDQVMHLGWKCLLPLALLCLAFYALLIALYDWKNA